MSIAWREGRHACEQNGSGARARLPVRARIQRADEQSRTRTVEPLEWSRPSLIPVSELRSQR
eukprot:2980810-Pleurochrysis_carterae.AAC.2